MDSPLSTARPGKSHFFSHSLIALLRINMAHDTDLHLYQDKMTSTTITTTTTTSTISSTIKHLKFKVIMKILVTLLTINYASNFVQAQLEGSSVSSSSDMQQPPTSSQQHQEILAQPYSQVRFECKLPQTAPSNHRSYYWNFQRSSTGSTSGKPDILCFETKCPEEVHFGFELQMDTSSGAYDLAFHNVTYELNDGFYYCDYKDSSPESKQVMNREIRLIVLIPPSPPTIVPATSIPAREGQEHQLNCITLGGNPEPNITWFRNDQPIYQIGQQVRIEQNRHGNGSFISTLTWIPTMDDHHAAYKCLVWNRAMGSMPAYERELRLQVEYAPRINIGPFNPLRVVQNSATHLTCQVDANPPVKGVRWYRDGVPLGNNYNFTITDAKPTDSGIYSCQADNGIIPLLVGSPMAGLHGQVVGPASNLLSMLNWNGPSDLSSGRSAPSVVEAQLQLQVLYPPRVKVSTSRNLPLNEGDSLLLNCSVDANPPVHEYIWTKQDDPAFKRVILAASQSPALEFQALAAADMGNYTCTAINRMDPSPVGRGLTLLGEQQLQQASLERSASASHHVQVRHKPGLAEIVLGQGGETELGSKTLIQCKTRPPGFPEPQYKFWKFHGPGQQKLHLNKPSLGNTYTIFSAKPDDEAKYGCVATNELGISSEADGDLIVNEFPTIIHDTSARREEDARQVGEFSYLITFRASGKPEPKVSWFHRSPNDGRKIDLTTQPTKYKIETLSKPDGPQTRPKYNVVSSLIFKQPLEVADRGLYYAEFNNGLSRVATEQYQLHIHHSPIPMAKNQPLIVIPSSAISSSGGQAGSQLQQQMSYKIKAGFDLGENVNLTCRVSAYPKPEFLWFPSSAAESDKHINTETNPRYRISVTNPRDDIWESTLSFSQLQESDYGDYMCVSANHDSQVDGLGPSVRTYIQLMHKKVPDSPTQLEAIDSTPNSVTLQWMNGFDGGLSGNFYQVQYALDDGTSLARRYPALADAPANSLELSTGEVYPKVHECHYSNPCTISQLQARQAYVFRVRARNELGSSEFSDELKISTRANASQIPRILDASFDPAQNILYFKLESNTEYPLSNLNARIEVRSIAQFGSDGQLAQPSGPSTPMEDPIPAQEITSSGSIPVQTSEWRPHSTLPMIPIRQERIEVHLSVQPEKEQLRITLCSRSNESICGPETIVPKSTTMGFLFQNQRGFSIPVLLSTLALIVILGAFATTVHSCCLAQRKKADSIEHVQGSIDNKPAKNSAASGNTNGSATGNNNLQSAKNPHGSSSAASTNSTNGANGLQSMESISGGLTGGSASDHSSDHSRQAKLDSMLPPNYNHYADRASIMLEQQQQQQQQHLHLMQQQAGLRGDKLGSPFGLTNSALLSVSQQQQQQQQPSPIMTDSMNHFAYTQSQLDPQQHDLHHHQMLGATNMMLNSSSGLEHPDVQQQQQQQMWSAQLDDYNNYNALASYATSGQQQEQMIDPTYGTTGPITGAGGGVIMPPHSASYDNSANSSAHHQFHQPYMSAYQHHQDAAAQQYQQQRAQYQQELAQQQLYGTLTRNGYNNTLSGNKQTNNPTNELKSSPTTQQQQQQLIEQQQQYSTNNGLIPPPIIGSQQQQQQQQNQESDYGTTGSRSGRLIREIIV